MPLCKDFTDSVSEVNKWLGCDVWNFGTCGRFSLKSEPYFFEAHPPKHGQHAETQRLDERDACVDSLEDSLFPSTENEVLNHCDNSAPQMSRQDVYIQASAMTSDDVSCSSNPFSSTSNDDARTYFSQTSMTSKPNKITDKESLPSTPREEVPDFSSDDVRSSGEKCSSDDVSCSGENFSSDDVRSSGEKFSPEHLTSSENLLRQAISQVCARDNTKHTLGTDTPDSGYGGHSRNSSDPELYTLINKPRC